MVQTCKTFDELAINDAIYTIDTTINQTECKIAVSICCIQEIQSFNYYIRPREVKSGKVFHFTNGNILKFYGTELKNSNIFNYISDTEIFYRIYKASMEAVKAKLSEYKDLSYNTYLDKLSLFTRFHNACKERILRDNRASFKIYSNLTNEDNLIFSTNG